MDRSKGQFQNYSSSFQHLTHHTSYLFFLKHFHLAASQDAHFNHWFSPNVFSLFRPPGQALLLLTSRNCSATGFSLWPSPQSILMVHVGESAPVSERVMYTLNISIIWQLLWDNHKTSGACKISVYYVSFWRGLALSVWWSWLDLLMFLLIG